MWLFSVALVMSGPIVLVLTLASYDAHIKKRLSEELATIATGTAFLRNLVCLFLNFRQHPTHSAFAAVGIAATVAGILLLTFVVP